MVRREHSQGSAGRPRAFAGLLALSLALCLALAGTAYAGPAPSEQVTRFNAALIAAMRGGGMLGFEGRYKLIEGAAREVFDFPGMARASAGSYWPSLGEAGQSGLVEAFTRLSIATYAARFDGWSGERFELKGESPAGRGAVLVANELVRTEGTPVAINYVLRDGEGGWRVADIMLEAKYSELAVKRSEFTAVLKTDGLAGLLARIEERIAQLRAGAAK